MLTWPWPDGGAGRCLEFTQLNLLVSAAVVTPTDKRPENTAGPKFWLEPFCHVLATWCHNPVYASKTDRNSFSNWNLAY